MYVLYIDDSGSVANANENHFVLGGVAVFERTVYHILRELDDCVDSFGLAGDDIELHATDIAAGRKQPWKSIQNRVARENLLHCSLGVATRQSESSTRFFAVAVDKAGVSPRDPVELAFEEICNRFNLFLQRTHDRTGHNNRGLIVMDESRHEKPLQSLARNFRINGARWGNFRYLAEVPFFADSKSTRLLQLADLVAWSVFRKFEYSDGRFLDPVLPRFDQDGGVLHGLYHARGATVGRCLCPACLTRERR